MFFSVVVMTVGAHLCHQDELQVLHNISMTGLLQTLKINQWSRETNAKCSNKIESTDSNNCFLFLSIPWSIDSFQYWPTLTLWYYPLHTSWKFSFRLYQRKGTTCFLITPTGRLFFVCCKCLSHVAAELNTTITIKLRWSPSKQKDGGRVLVRGREVPIFWVCNSSPVGMGDIMTSVEEKRTWSTMVVDCMVQSWVDHFVTPLKRRRR